MIRPEFIRLGHPQGAPLKSEFLIQIRKLSGKDSLMSERSAANSKKTALNQTASSPAASTGQQPQGAPLDGYRVDAAHSGSHVAGPHFQSPGGHFVSSAAPAGSQKSIAASERELQLQARQISQHLRSQFAELDRREKNLNEQMSSLDQEQRAARLHLQQLENELLDREASLRSKEIEVEQRLRKCEQLVADLDEKQADLDAQLEALEQQRKSYREELKRELLHNWNVLGGRVDSRSADGAKGTPIVASNAAPVPADPQFSEAQLRKAVEAEVAAVRAELEAELETERRNWEEQKAADYAEIERERELTAEATRRAQAQLEELRASQQVEFDALTERNQLLLEERQRALKEEFHSEREVYAAHLDEARQQIHDLQTKLQQTELKLNSQTSRNRVLEAEVERSKLDTESRQSSQKEELDASILAMEAEYE
ncbi:MAG: hypothetical protein CMJ46_10955, partial [Planctomyces sp.]|nr:hypothetical protein [Planctomyces sp.]